uniref:Uncharacterized protein n=1 Tax=Anguilla anguilla TaxID=7936 RepID=A0A0E9UCW6_ANGAN
MSSYIRMSMSTRVQCVKVQREES